MRIFCLIRYPMWHIEKRLLVERMVPEAGWEIVKTMKTCGFPHLCASKCPALGLNVFPREIPIENRNQNYEVKNTYSNFSSGEQPFSYFSMFSWWLKHGQESHVSFPQTSYFFEQYMKWYTVQDTQHTTSKALEEPCVREREEAAGTIPCGEPLLRGHQVKTSGDT